MQLYHLALDRPDLQFSIKRAGPLDAPTVGHLEMLKKSRQIRVWTWALDPGVCATNRGTVSCRGVHRLRSRRLPENMHKCTTTTQGVMALSSGGLQGRVQTVACGCVGEALFGWCRDGRIFLLPDCFIRRRFRSLGLVSSRSLGHAQHSSVADQRTCPDQLFC